MALGVPHEVLFNPYAGVHPHQTGTNRGCPGTVHRHNNDTTKSFFIIERADALCVVPHMDSQFANADRQHARLAELMASLSHSPLFLHRLQTGALESPACDANMVSSDTASLYSGIGTTYAEISAIAMDLSRLYSRAADQASGRVPFWPWKNKIELVSWVVFQS